MSTSLGVVLRRLAMIGIVVGVLTGILMLFSYDVLKLDWMSFMELQPSFKWMKDPLPPPDRSIPVEGPIAIPNLGAPANPVPADEVSVSRGRELFMIDCQMCHGPTGEGNGPIAAAIVNKPANLTSSVTQSKSDGALFLTITNGVPGRMPPMNENFVVRDRWDLVNFIRTLKPTIQPTAQPTTGTTTPQATQPAQATPAVTPTP
ncbi:MAG TPA: cytochrome c [Anaerolineales bacterium]